MVAAALALSVGGCKKTEDSAAKPEEPATAQATEPAAAAEAAAAAPQVEPAAPPEPPAQVDVPDFTGKTMAEAMKDAVRAGLVAQVAQARRADSAAPGTVVAQKPAKGEKVDRLSPVELVPRQEPPPPVQMVDVPSVVGKSLKDARAILFDKGFTPQTGKPKFTGKTPGLVLDQNPDANRKAARGSVVQIVPEKQSVVVPDLRNQPIVDAILKIRNVDLDWEGSSEMTTRIPAGSVLEQSPKPGARAEEGTEVKLTIAKAPPSGGGAPKWCSNFDDLKELHSRDISEVTRLLGKVMPRNYVSALQLEPRSPAQRWSGEHVNVSFSYATEHGNDVMVFVIPALKGKLIPGASSIKFRTQPDGQDTFKGSFTVYTQTPVVVDALHVFMYDLRPGHFYKKLYESKFPVQIRFSPAK
jgi:beta-lactam-binding protein with PASTA domain